MTHQMWIKLYRPQNQNRIIPRSMRYLKLQQKMKKRRSVGHLVHHHHIRLQKLPSAELPGPSGLAPHTSNSHIWHVLMPVGYAEVNDDEDDHEWETGRRSTKIAHQRRTSWNPRKTRRRNKEARNPDRTNMVKGRSCLHAVLGICPATVTLNNPKSKLQNLQL